MSLFGTKPFAGTTTTQYQPSGSLFGTTIQPQSQPSLPSTRADTVQPSSTSLFAVNTISQPLQQSDLFGSSLSKPTQANSLFGPNQPGQQQQGSITLGVSTNEQIPGLFRSLGQDNLPQNQQSAEQRRHGTSLSQQSMSRIWSEQQTPRQKSVAEQISLIYQKWNPQSPLSTFHTYLYNTVSPKSAPFYRPGPNENEEKWEDALRAAPNPGQIPILVKGFEQLGHRIISQEHSIRILRGRLHEINNGLSEMLRKHDLEISTRAAECKRRHVRLSQKCLALATKTQILRNRGYALDGAEEELAQKLKKLERQIIDPALNGRGEEIWARMVNVRERGRWLQGEFEKAGTIIENAKGGIVDEEVFKQASKILEDYDTQLSHLAVELNQLKIDFEDWEKTGINLTNQCS